MLRAIAGLLLLTASAALASSAPLAPRSSVDQDLRDAQREAQRATAEQLRLEQAADQAQDEVERLHARQLAAMEAIAAAEAAISHRRSIRSITGSDRAEPTGYPMKVSEVNVSEVTIE